MQAGVTLEKVATFDADEDFFVVISHDRSLLAQLPFFPASLGGWKKSGLKERSVWSFVDPGNLAFVFSPV